MGYEITEYRKITSHRSLPGQVVSGIESCIDSAFSGRISQEDARGHISGDQLLVARHELEVAGDEILAFSSTSIDSPRQRFEIDALAEDEGAYFAAAAIRSDIQSKGLYHQLNERRLDFALDEGADFVFTRTQNPRVEEGITRSVDKLLEQRRIRDYEVGRLVCLGVYGKMLTKDRPLGREVVYDDLDYDNGDGVIITWRLRA